LGYAGAKPIAGFFSSETESPIPVSFLEEAKTDFISVAIFEGKKVRGYFSFRVAFSISDAERAPEIGYLASDVAIRKALSVSDISMNTNALSEKFERAIKAQIEAKMPSDLVEEVKLVDFGFDARI
jgi:hypothetical protein